MEAKHLDGYADFVRYLPPIVFFVKGADSRCQKPGSEDLDGQSKTNSEGRNDVGAVRVGKQFSSIQEPRTLMARQGMMDAYDGLWSASDYQGSRTALGDSKA